MDKSKRTIYFGFNIDMDRAYNSTFNSDKNVLVGPSKKESEYLEGMNDLLEFFNEHNMGKSNLWLVNEGAYYQCYVFQKFLLNLKKYGDFGMHTHFNTEKFKGTDITMSNDNNDYLIEGLVEPKNRLEQLLEVPINIFKSGNHITNDSYWDDLFNTRFLYDCTPVINDRDRTHGMFNFEIEWKYGSIPKYKQGVLVIPELRPQMHHIKNHVKRCLDDQPIFVRIQLHPWDNHALPFYKLFMEELNKEFNVVPKSFYEMIELHHDYMQRNKSVKLVIWDLDEVAWNGSLIENTIQLHNKHNQHTDRVLLFVSIVRFLNSHGIINSICSKNNFDDAKNTLEKLKIFDLFVFPQISMNNKGQSVKHIIDKCQLRPENVLFIDDNHTNKEEVKHFNKNIMVEDENFIFRIFNDGRFKNLKEKNRLEDYKILEKKDADKMIKYDNDISTFLKDSDIRINLQRICNNNNKMINDRVFELINRTNQLNYTKIRLTQKEVETLLNNNKCENYIVIGKDLYANYGNIGFISILNDQIVHYCFSCRLLGSNIENYIWKFLEYKKINIVGNVTTPLNKDVNINWITIDKTLLNKNKDDINKLDYANVLLIGSCDIQPIVPYLHEYFIIREGFGNLVNQSAMYLFTQNVNEENSNLILQHSSNMYNYNTFTLNVNSSTKIIVISLGDTYNKRTIIHKKSNVKLSFINDEDLKNLNENEFIPSGPNMNSNKYITSEEFLNILTDFIKMYSEYKIIFINGAEVEAPGDTFNGVPQHVLYKQLNAVLDNFIDNKNTYLIDVRKYIKSSEDLCDNTNINHFNREKYIDIANEIKKYAMKIYNFNNISIFHMKNIIYDKKNIEINIDYENNILSMKLINTPSNSYGASFYTNLQTGDYNCIFDCKLETIEEEEVFPKIYTGKKWVILDTPITNEFKTFNLSEHFSFGIGSSKWRISSTSKMAGQNITYKDLTLNIQ